MVQKHLPIRHGLLLAQELLGPSQSRESRDFMNGILVKLDERLRTATQTMLELAEVEEIEQLPIATEAAGALGLPLKM